MDFYIGNSMDEVNYDNECASFSDEFSDYLWKRRHLLPDCAMSLFDIDPYDDVIIDINSVYNIVELCKFIIDSSILDDYKNSYEAQHGDEYDEVKEMVESLYEIGKKAIELNNGLISIGD